MKFRFEVITIVSLLFVVFAFQNSPPEIKIQPSHSFGQQAVATNEIGIASLDTRMYRIERSDQSVDGIYQEQFQARIDECRDLIESCNSISYKRILYLSIFRFVLYYSDVY